LAEVKEKESAARRSNFVLFLQSIIQQLLYLSFLQQRLQITNFNPIDGLD
jgi:hypothetical protein